MKLEDDYDLLDEIKLENKNIRFFWNDVLQIDGMTQDIKYLDGDFNNFIKNIFIKFIGKNLIDEPNNYSIYIENYDITIFFYIDHINYDDIEIYIIYIKNGICNNFAKKTFSFNQKEEFNIIFEDIRENDDRIIFERLCGYIVETNIGYDYFDILDLYKNTLHYNIISEKFKNFFKLLKENSENFKNKDIANEIYDMV